MSLSIKQAAAGAMPALLQPWTPRGGAVVWLTGLSGAGKSTLAALVQRRLQDSGQRSFFLDGDQLRQGLCSDLGFSAADRRENLRRAAELCQLLVDAGHIVLAAFISPSHDDRAMVRDTIRRGEFIEVYCNASLSTCEQRDVKGLYARARRGEIPNFTGISAPYDVPETPNLELPTGSCTVDDAVHRLIDLLVRRGIALPL